MFQDIQLPEELLIAVGSETKDFVVKGTRLRPVSGSLQNLILGSIWVGAFIWIGFALFGPFGTSGDPSSESTSLKLYNEDGTLNQDLGIYLLYALFLFPGIWQLTKTIIPLLKPGGIFIGTPKKLLNYRNGEIIIYDWDMFTMKTKVRGNAAKGSLTLIRTTGYQTKTNRAGNSYYIPYIVYMSGIPDVLEIEKICKQRIKESDTFLADK
ncbi:MAG: hypothetical protein IPN68_13855 [Bacteroidetes bacterium]|nr:hypothetical protein [Bacteroidota bacterium]